MQGLGELEALVMDVVWNTSAAVRVRDVIDQLEDGREPAYTTIQTVLDNLHRKGWVHRQRNGRAYWYEATRSREEAASDALRILLESTGDPTSVLLHFARGASDDESKVLTRGLKERQR
ncbi:MULTISPECIES: BlaI/MecI/CopY family transcriptional regulator [Nocardiaceae]|jgi:predicted transcriptional regulator|uniref:BlaI/MecI/CopY family transcriptional regulator n=4 Tax=root TaxID=1 RepID=A0ABU9D0W8_9NOCA|nr:MULTISPECIES: BlaI/MecI/CopY family transcriptional regulator [Rhodococcus]MSX04733.1 BlaI/MecI/CopY family transcriptional regulator [Actinomycetota bacterium]KAA0921750.1 BlaI/MecI/CopY family transcriptional regulator [Rhodococcus sp. ANT_H53B]KJV03654.1 putative BlaI family transcriptional regulator [Rhodococcus sp. PML026]KZF03212.1 penicillinase repressor [Rhodococcus sp. EPR-147]KZF04083.1 penicillinase repressor [Rhodococcus sp. EPR-279]